MLNDILDLNYAWTFLGVIIALGAIAIAILQVLNELTPMRLLFHAAWVRFWIGERVSEYHTMVESASGNPASPLPPVPPLSRKDHEPSAFDMLVASATGGLGNAFLGLPTNQLVGQINAAAQTVLENPVLYYPLLSVLAQPTLPTVRPYAWGTPKTELPARGHLADLAMICAAADRGGAKGEPDYLEARARIGHAIQRNLDGIQITLTNRVTQSTLILALAISIGLSYLVLQGRSPLNILLLGAAAGYVAPVIGDMVIALRRFGQR